MFRRGEVAAGALVAATAFVLAQSGMGMQLVPVGFVAGLVAVRAPTAPDGLIRGGKAGALGGVLFVGAVALGAGLRIAPVAGAYAVDLVLFQGFALAWFVVPWYGMAGMLAGPVVYWVAEKAVAAERRYGTDDVSGGQ